MDDSGIGGPRDPKVDNEGAHVKTRSKGDAINYYSFQNHDQETPS